MTSKFTVEWSDDMDIQLQIEKMKAWAQTQASPKVDLITLAKLCLQFWSPEDAVTAVAVAGAESGYRIQARNYARNKTNDYGLFQINDIHQPDLTKVYEPEYNVQRAYGIYLGRKRRDGVGWTAWVAYKNNKHEPFLEKARVAIAQALEENKSNGFRP